MTDQSEQTTERVPRPRYDDLSVPDVLLALYDWVMAWDHAAGRAWVISFAAWDRPLSSAPGDR